MLVRFSTVQINHLVDEYQPLSGRFAEGGRHPIMAECFRVARYGLQITASTAQVCGALATRARLGPPQFARARKEF